MARTFEDMPTLGTPSPTRSPPFHQRRRSWARKVERCCCQTAAHFPLLIVYGLTTWAVWVEVMVSFLGSSWLAYPQAGLGIALWLLANVSYSTAVFTNPGSPLDPREDLSKKRDRRRGYEGLPTDADEAQHENVVPAGMTMITAKSSTGEPRFCKKCRCVKPDRSHHCSTCGRCVLKMDHHCPWLATCVGLRNYKPFVLFLSYTSLFCWLCLAVSASWVWREIFEDAQMQEGLLVVNTVMLAVLSGIVGLVLSCFTGWHLHLAATGQTTIESLEKTRYLSPLQKSTQQGLQPSRHYIGQASSNEDQPLAERLKEMHANALPGVLRPEEGEEDSRSHSPTTTRSTSSPIPSATLQSNHSPAKASLQRTYSSLEAQREQSRYDAYLDEQDSERLPNAFDQGWKHNLQHVFGDRPALWLLPICNTSGDGWQWEVSALWLEVRAEAAQRRERRAQQENDERREHAQRPWFAAAPPLPPPPARREMRWQPGQGFVGDVAAAPPLHSYVDGEGSQVQMQPLDRKGGKRRGGEDVDDYDTSSDEDVKRMYNHVGVQGHNSEGVGRANWNDVPDEFRAPGRFRKGERSTSRGRRKGD